MKDILFYLLVLYTIPFAFLRTKFRKMVYKTHNPLIALQPKFVKETKVIFGFITLTDAKEKKLLKQYRYYISILLLLYITYLAI